MGRNISPLEIYANGKQKGYENYCEIYFCDWGLYKKFSIGNFLACQFQPGATVIVNH